MRQLIENARRVLGENEVISFPRNWPAKAVVVRNNKKAVLFNQAEPSSRQIFVISEVGNLYVYEDGDIEFVVTDDEGKEHSVSLAQIKEAKEVYDSADENLMNWGFSGLDIEEGKLLFEFMPDDTTLWRPRVLVDLVTKTTEYFPDGENDDVF